jgi:arylsulfatase A-like enzyme
VPPKGAPNVLLIITDDAGFGVPSTPRSQSTEARRHRRTSQPLKQEPNANHA